MKKIILSFYRYVPIKNPMALRNKLFCEWQKLSALGRIYIANEGINAQISLPEANFDFFKKNLQKRKILRNIPLKIALEQGEAFKKLTIKVKKYMVADGLKPGSYDLQNIGKHLSAEHFNQMLEGKNTLVIDVRNHYESRLGHFQNAVTPDCDTFREELPMISKMLDGRQKKKILLYCTGGIRCEKASAYLKSQGFDNVYQLYGGIINYVHEVRKLGLECKFKGRNFVFDQRLGERVTEDILTTCDQCQASSDDITNCANVICNLLFVQCSQCRQKFHNCCSEKCLQLINLPEEEQKKLRKAQTPTNSKIFKSRQRPNLKDV